MEKDQWQLVSSNLPLSSALPPPTPTPASVCTFKTVLSCLQSTLLKILSGKWFCCPLPLPRSSSGPLVLHLRLHSPYHTTRPWEGHDGAPSQRGKTHHNSRMMCRILGYRNCLLASHDLPQPFLEQGKSRVKAARKEAVPGNRSYFTSLSLFPYAESEKIRLLCFTFFKKQKPY